jgi:hypothetical protein
MYNRSQWITSQDKFALKIEKSYKITKKGDLAQFGVTLGVGHGGIAKLSTFAAKVIMEFKRQCLGDNLAQPEQRKQFKVCSWVITEKS